MMALRAADATVRRDALVRFRSQADRGLTGTEPLRSHRDGWGLVGVVAGELVHLGRHVEDASTDALYPEAADLARGADDGTWVLAHVRNASVGAKRLENTHPFVRAGWAFAHNGTIEGLAPPPGSEPEGETDSEAYFLHLLAAYQRTRDMAAAIAEVVPRLEAGHRHTSLTFLLTDGRELHAFRRVGPDPGECVTRACALEHYALGVGQWQGATVVVQEPPLLPGLRDWTEATDGELVSVAADDVRRRATILRPLAARV